jgi:hypothetical protein
VVRWQVHQGWLNAAGRRAAEAGGSGPGRLAAASTQGGNGVPNRPGRLSPLMTVSRPTASPAVEPAHQRLDRSPVLLWLDGIRRLIQRVNRSRPGRVLGEMDRSSWRASALIVACQASLSDAGQQGLAEGGSRCDG